MSVKLTASEAIPCPDCGEACGTVVDVRGAMAGYIRRRRRCDGCGRLVTTREQLVEQREAAVLARWKHDALEQIGRLDGHPT